MSINKDGLIAALQARVSQLEEFIDAGLYEQEWAGHPMRCAYCGKEEGKSHATFCSYLTISNNNQ